MGASSSTSEDASEDSSVVAVVDDDDDDGLVFEDGGVISWMFVWESFDEPLMLPVSREVIFVVAVDVDGEEEEGVRVVFLDFAAVVVLFIRCFMDVTGVAYLDKS